SRDWSSDVCSSDLPVVDSPSRTARRIARTREGAPVSLNATRIGPRTPATGAVNAGGDTGQFQAARTGALTFGLRTAVSEAVRPGCAPGARSGLHSAGGYDGCRLTPAILLPVQGSSLGGRGQGRARKRLKGTTDDGRGRSGVGDATAGRREHTVYTADSVVTGCGIVNECPRRRICP